MKEKPTEGCAGDKPAYWVRLQYDPNMDHFLVDGSFESMRKQAHVTGFKADQILGLYVVELMHEIEVLKRQQRKPTEPERKTPGSN